MKVGIIGSGGREHALCLSIKQSSKVEKIYCFPGNAGTSEIAQNVEIDLSDFNKIKEYSITNEINLLIVGPEKPLVDGIVDFFNDSGINIFGPDKISSQLEGSKIFTKKYVKITKFLLLNLEFLKILVRQFLFWIMLNSH